MIEWQPIETAPKDTTVVLGYFRVPGSLAYRLMYFAGGIERWIEYHTGNHIRPTHWIPLPQPPTPGGGA